MDMARGSLPVAASDHRILNAQIFNGMSVDVEEWFQVGAFENVIERGQWGTLGSRVEANCDAILELFEQAQIRATFFTLGWVAQRHAR